MINPDQAQGNASRVGIRAGAVSLIDTQKHAFRNKLNELSNRVRKWTDEFRKSGEFSDVHRALLTEIQGRSDALDERVRQAEERGSSWEILKAEFVRDFSSLQDDLLLFEERLDSEAMKKR